MELANRGHGKVTGRPSMGLAYKNEDMNGHTGRRR